MSYIDKLEAFLLIMIGIIMTYSCVVLVVFWSDIEDYRYSLNNEAPTSELEIMTRCEFLDLNEAVQCMRRNIKMFYSYNITEDSWKLTWDEINERGGDCRDWAHMYMRLSESLGFNATYVVIPIEGRVHHGLAMISNPNFYCYVDQLYVQCYEVSNA